MGHLRHRQNPLGETYFAQELESWFDEIASRFGTGWLNEAGEHPLQQLWGRRDPLSTNELATLGYALRRMGVRDDRWLRAQVKLVKGKDRNNSAAALFEIIGLAHFNNPNGEMIPAKGSQAGYDGLLRFASGKGIYLSLKRYGTSVHQQEFVRRAEATRAILLSALHLAKVERSRFLIVAKRYPNHTDWTTLRQGVQEIVRAFDGASAVYETDGWLVCCAPLGDDLGVPASGQVSYVLQMISPHHPNESDNLRDKLEDACRNLARHGVSEGGRSVNAIYVHVPPSASIPACETWLRDWFDRFPGKPVSAVLLYQPAVVRIHETDQSQIYHCFRTVVSARYVDFVASDQSCVPNCVLPVGRVGQEPSREVLISDGKDVQNMGEAYVYQRGDVYVEASGQTDGSLVGHLRSSAPGVFVHSVVQPFPSDRKFLVRGRFAPGDELLIL